MDINELLKDVKSFNKEAAMKENMRMLALKDSVMTDAFNEANVKLASYLGGIKLDSPESNLTEFSRNKLSGKMKAILSVSTTAGLKRLPIHFVVKASVPYMVETPEQVVAALEKVEGSLDKEVREILEKQKGLTDYHNEAFEEVDNILDSIKKQVENKEITLEQAGEQLFDAGWFNYIPTEEQTKQKLGIKAELKEEIKVQAEGEKTPAVQYRDFHTGRHHLALFNTREEALEAVKLLKQIQDTEYPEGQEGEEDYIMDMYEAFATSIGDIEVDYRTVQNDPEYDIVNKDWVIDASAKNSTIKVQAKKKEIDLVNRENTAASQFPVKLLVYPKTYLPELKKGDVVNVGGFKYKYIGDEPLLNGDTENGINARFELMRTDKKASLNKKAADDKKENKSKKSEEDEDKEQRDKDFKDKLKFMQEEKHFEDLDPSELMAMVTTYRYYHILLPREALDAISQSADSASRYMSSFDSLEEAFDEATPKIVDRVVSSPRYLLSVLKNYSDDIDMDKLPKQVKDKLMSDVGALVDVVKIAPSLLTDEVAEKIIKESPTEAENIYTTFGTVENKGKGWDKINEWAEENKVDQAPTSEELGIDEDYQSYKPNVKMDEKGDDDYDAMSQEEEDIPYHPETKREVLGPNTDDTRVEDEENKKSSAVNNITKEAAATEFSTNLKNVRLDISNKYMLNILKEKGIEVGSEVMNDSTQYAIETLSSDDMLKWSFDFSGGDQGIEFFQIRVPDQTIDVNVEYYTPKEYEGDGELSKTTVQVPLSNVSVITNTTNTIDEMTLYPESITINDNGGVEVSF